MYSIPQVSYIQFCLREIPMETWSQSFPIRYCRCETSSWQANFYVRETIWIQTFQISLVKSIHFMEEVLQFLKRDSLNLQGTVTHSFAQATDIQGKPKWLDQTGPWFWRICPKYSIQLHRSNWWYLWYFKFSVTRTLQPWSS